MPVAGCRISNGRLGLLGWVVIIGQFRVRFLRGSCAVLRLFGLLADRSMHLQSSKSALDPKTTLGLLAAIIPALAFGKSYRHQAYVGTYTPHPLGRRGGELD